MMLRKIFLIFLLMPFCLYAQTDQQLKDRMDIGVRVSINRVFDLSLMEIGNEGIRLRVSNNTGGTYQLMVRGMWGDYATLYTFIGVGGNEQKDYNINLRQIVPSPMIEFMLLNETGEKKFINIGRWIL